VRPSEYTPELLERWRGELPGLEARLPDAKGNERGVIVSKVWIRKRALGMIPAEETLQEFRSRYYADRKEAKLSRYREELPRLREELAKETDERERYYLRSRIETREVALGLKTPSEGWRRKNRVKAVPGEMHEAVCWHFEHPGDYAPLCLEREPGSRLSPAGWKTTASWRHVTCFECLKLRGTDADPQKGRGLEEKGPAPCCGNCGHWVPGNSQALGGRFFGVCTARPGERIATEAGAHCGRWAATEEDHGN